MLLKFLVMTLPSLQQAGYMNKSCSDNYGKTTANPTASQDYGEWKYPWLADYSNNWIPEWVFKPCLWASQKFGQGMQANGYRMSVYLNTNHEVVVLAMMTLLVWYKQGKSMTKVLL